MHSHQNIVAICSFLVICRLEYAIELTYIVVEPAPLSCTLSLIKGDLVPGLDPNAIGQPPSKMPFHFT